MASNPWGDHVPEVDAGTADRELHAPATASGDRTRDTVPANQVKEIVQLYPNLDDSELARLDVLTPGTRLRQGSVYLDLVARGRGPFQAIGGETVGEGQRLIAKSWTDYDIWNRLAGQDAEPRVDRP